MDRIILVNDDKDRLMLVSLVDFIHMVELAEKFATANNTRNLSSFKNKLVEISNFFNL